MDNGGLGGDVAFKRSMARIVREAILGEISDEALEEMWCLLTERLRKGQGEQPGSAAVAVDALLTPTQAAVLANVSVSTIRNWQNARHLTKHHRGRVSRAELLRYLATGGKSPEEAVQDFARAGEDSSDEWALSVLRERRRRRGE